MEKENQKMYYIILKNLKNGLDELKSIPFTEKPSNETIENSRVFYGAKSAEVIFK